MKKLAVISGFPEWLPEEKLLEEKLIAIIKDIYASHGFVPIETPSVELLDTLVTKGVAEREIFVVRRLAASEDDEISLGLHFDLTVPFARYVAQHFNGLKFPFKRYQLQKVWRGERPQKGRFREFYQFDIDTIALDELPLSCDAEVLTVYAKVFAALGIGEFKIHLNTRKILYGYYSSLGLSSELQRQVIGLVDKVQKIGKDGVFKELTQTLGVSSITAGKVLECGEINADSKSFKTALTALGVKNEVFEQGMEEIETVFSLIPEENKKYFKLDLSLARGLDYYTGIVFETQLVSYPRYGSVASGGRYDDLASQFINKKLPGVGGSIGLTRLMDLILSEKLLALEKRSTAQVLVAVYNEDQRIDCNKLAEKLRVLGLGVEVYYRSPKLGKQIDYAADRGMCYVFFISPETGKVEVKDLNSKQQISVADLEEWYRKIQ